MRGFAFKRVSGLALAAMLSLGLAGAGHAAEVTLRLGLSSFNKHPFNLAAERYRKKVAELSHGAIEIKVFPNRQLGGVKELTEGVRFGTVDMTINSSSAMADLIPAIDALQLPFLINSYSDLARLAVTPEAEALSAGLAKKGAYALAIYGGGERHFLTIKRVVKSVADFKGLKTRVAPVRLHLDIWRALGANPTPMAYGEVYTALETGTIDAVETNISSILNEKYYEVGKHVLLDGHYFWPGLLMVNKARMDSLKPEYQAILRKAAKDIVKPQIQALDEYDHNAMEVLKKKGVEFRTASPEMLEQMRKAVEPVFAEYVKKDPAIKPFVEAARRMQTSAKSQ
jgi:TRAP-type transport system periplasmic protein